MAADLDTRRKRAAYRAAHRGTKEMDWLLGRFATDRLDTMDEAALGQFEALLEEPDPVLQQWIMDGRTIPDDRHAALIRELRIFHELARKPQGAD
jgi:antitoxin CptB